MKAKHTPLALALSLATVTASHAAIIAQESFDYSTAGYGTGLEGPSGGTGFSGAWKEFGSNANNGVFAGNVTVGSDAATTPVGNHARVQLSSAGAGIGRNLSSTIGTDNTTAWLSYHIQNNNTSAGEAFAVVFTSLSESRSVVMGATAATGGQSLSDGMFDLAYQPTGANADYAARDTSNHFIVVRFDFGVGNSDTVTLFNDPTLATNFSGTGSAQISGVDATFDGIAFTATNATLQWDEIRIGTELSDVTSVPEPSSTALFGLAGVALLLRRRTGKFESNL
ncbi:MAG: PEP-CTERM sorting domain-containing protein [Akkermansiaceae bacterium]